MATDDAAPDLPRLLTFSQLDVRSAAFDARVAESPAIDLFCSSSDWVLPARLAFAPRARPFVLELQEGFVALMSVPTVEGGRALLPLEASWGLASPFIGPEPEALVAGLFRLMDQAEPPADAMFLSGVEPEGRAFRAIEAQAAASRRWIFYEGATAGRHAADLSGGPDAFLARRSAKFRANARRERRLAGAAGVTYEAASRFDTPEAVLRTWERIQAVERRCWKGLSGHGIDQDPGYTFYRVMVLRLAAKGRLRVVFARQGDDDIAYVFGGVFGETYRGLQCSFVDEHRAHAPGVLVHLEMIERLCAEGVSLYDLGSEMEYKRRWGEPGLTTVTCVIVRSH